MTLRRLFVLVKGLPLEGRVKTELRAVAEREHAKAKTARLERAAARYGHDDAEGGR